MHSFLLLASLFKRASEPYEFAFAAILFVFHQSQNLVPRFSHSLSWPPFWINFHPPWTNRSRDFCCVPGSSTDDPPFWKSSRRRPWGRGCYCIAFRSTDRCSESIIPLETTVFILLYRCRWGNCSLEHLHAKCWRVLLLSRKREMLRISIKWWRFPRSRDNSAMRDNASRFQRRLFELLVTALGCSKIWQDR